MSDFELSRADLEAHLQEQIEFLKVSAVSFDGGFEGEAKRMATAIRVIVHDTRNSHSLLKQLGMKDILFSDTSIDVDPNNVVTHSGLVVININQKGTKFVAPLDDVVEERRIGFDDWWSRVVFVDDQKRHLTRRDLVLTAANQDGGAHVDPKINPTYAALSKFNSLKWMHFDGGKEHPLLGAERASIRQIAHEVIKTFDPEYRSNIKREGVMFANVSIRPATEEEAAQSEQKEKWRKMKIGRNAPCPCGSQKKFKRCHGG